jgi:hypothetical protein
MQNVQAAAHALKRGFVDRIVVAGKSSDSHGRFQDESYAAALHTYLDPAGLGGRVETILTLRQTFHTLTDLRDVMAELRLRGQDKNVTVISCAGQLSPKTEVAMRLLGYPHARFLSAEFLMHDLSEQVQAGKYGDTELIPVERFHTGVKVALYEGAFAAVSLLDLLPGNINLGTRVLDLLAGQSTLRKLRSKILG